MCVAHIGSHLFDLFGAFQVEMLIFFQRGLYFALFTKLNSMIDLPRIATLCSLNLNANTLHLFCSHKDCEKWMLLKLFKLRRCKRFWDISYVYANIHRTKPATTSGGNNNNSNKNHKITLYSRRKKIYKRFQLQNNFGKQYMWTKQQSRWYETFSCLLFFRVFMVTVLVPCIASTLYCSWLCKMVSCFGCMLMTKMMINRVLAVFVFVCFAHMLRRLVDET